MPQWHRYNVSAVVAVTLDTPLDTEEEFQPEMAMAKLRKELTDVRIDGKKLSIGHLVVKEN